VLQQQQRREELAGGLSKFRLPKQRHALHNSIAEALDPSLHTMDGLFLFTDTSDTLPWDPPQTIALGIPA